MSQHLVSRTDIDALVTVALQWTDAGHVAAMPEPARTILSVTPGNASTVGRVLWQANADGVSSDPGGTASVGDYRFEPLPGVASPAAATHVARYYADQTACETWDPHDPSARNGDPHPPFAAHFVTAVRWYALALRGALPLDRVPEPLSPELDAAEATLAHDGVTLPRGLDESDRDAFERAL